MSKSYEPDYDLPQLTVGEIARVFGLSEQTIRFYHKKGILLPDERSDNTYRKYSWNKLSTLAQICFLRRAGFPIEDIKAYIQLDNPQDALAYMEKFIEKLQQDAREIQRAIGMLERKCSYLNALQSQTISESASFVMLPPRRYIYLGKDELTSACNEYFFDYPLIAAYHVGPSGAVHKVAIGAYLGDGMLSDKTADVRELPEQRCLICSFKGSYSSIYERISELYSEHAGFPLCRTAYAVNVVDHLVENDQNNYIVNIQIPLVGSDT